MTSSGGFGEMVTRCYSRKFTSGSNVSRNNGGFLGCSPSVQAANKCRLMRSFHPFIYLKQYKDTAKPRSLEIERAAFLKNRSYPFVVVLLDYGKSEILGLHII